MGMKNTSSGVNQPTRKISVGLLKPEKLEGNTIYITLKKDKNSIHAEAISTQDFVCPDYSKDGTFRSNNVSNFVGDYNGWYHVPYDIFIEGLQRENDAKVDYTPAISQGIEALVDFEELEEARASLG